MQKRMCHQQQLNNIHVCKKAEVSLCSLLNYACSDLTTGLDKAVWFFPARMILWSILNCQINKVSWLPTAEPRCLLGGRTGLFGLITVNEHNAPQRHLSWHGLQNLWGQNCPSAWQPTLWCTYSSCSPFSASCLGEELHWPLSEKIMKTG